jgi:hypothetical protein
MYFAVFDAMNSIKIRMLLEKLIVSQLFKRSHHFIEQEGTLLCRQKLPLFFSKLTITQVSALTHSLFNINFNCIYCPLPISAEVSLLSFRQVFDYNFVCIVHVLETRIKDEVRYQV